MQRSECIVGAEGDRESADVRLHRGIQVVVKTERIHFRYGLVRCPVLLRHAISRHHDTGSIATVITMNEKLLRGVLLKQFQEFSNLRVAWPRPTLHGDINEMHAERFGLLALAGYGTGIAAQINNRIDAKFFQLRKTLRGRLRAAKENVANFSGVGHTGYF